MPTRVISGKAALMAELEKRQTEAAFQAEVIAYAQERGWKVAHFRPAQTLKGWRTPVQGDKGFPDLVLARCGVVHHWELKAAGERPDDDQIAWLQALDGDWFRPEQWPLICALLDGPARGK